MPTRMIASVVSLSVLLTYSLLNMAHSSSLQINRDYLVRMVDELSTLCPYSSGCTTGENDEHRYTAIDVVPFNKTMSSCCTRCYCDDGCLAEHRCCPEVMLQRYSDGDLGNEMTYQCRMHHFKLPTTRRMYRFIYDGTFMTDTCLQPPETIGYNESVAMKCLEPDISNIDEMLPVTSMATGRVYINNYCAVCSGDDDVTPWLPYIYMLNSLSTPTDILPYYTEKTWQELYTLTYAPDSDLNLFLKSQFIANSWKRQCVAPVIYHCNATGLWETYDPFYEFACLVYRSIYFYTNSKGHITDVFGNVFCAICNGLDPNVLICNLPAPFEYTLPQYASLLLYQQAEYLPVIQGPFGGGDTICPATDFLDPLKNVCRPWKCPKGSHYNGDKCIATLNNFMGAAGLLFLTKVGPIDVIIDMSETEAMQLAQTLISSIFSKEEDNSPSGFYVNTYQIHWYTTKMPKPTQKYLLIFFNSLVVTNITKAQSNAEAFIGMMKTKQNVSSLVPGMASKVTATSADYIVIRESSYTPYEALTVLNIDDRAAQGVIYGGNRRKGIVGMWRVSNLDVCTSFVLHQDEYTQHEHYIALSYVDVSFYSTQYDATGLDNGVRLCVDDYIDAVSKYSANSGHGLSCNVGLVFVLILTQHASNVARALFELLKITV